MNFDIVQVLADSGLAFLVTVVLIYWNRMDAKDRATEIHQDAAREREAIERQAAREREDKLLLLRVFKENTEVLAELLVTVKSFNGKDE